MNTTLSSCWLAILLLFSQPLRAQNDTLARPDSPLRQAIVQHIQTGQKPQLDLFVMSQCPFGVQAEEALIPILREFGDQVNFQLHYIVAPQTNAQGSSFRSLHGPNEVAENLRQLVIAERFPNQWLDYLLQRAKNHQTNDWQTAARQAGIDVGEVGRLSASPMAMQRLAAHSQQTLAQQVRSSPSLFIDGTLYQGSFQPVASQAQSGSCTVPADCNDNNRCTFDGCNPTTGCFHRPISCDDGNACTLDTCDPVNGCANTPISCNDNDPCTLDACNPTRGCVYTPIPAPAATLIASNTALCARGGALLTSVDGLTYRFTGPGGLVQDSPNPTLLATQTGVYSVMVRAGSNCTLTQSISLTVTPAPDAQLTFLNNGSVVQATGGSSYRFVQPLDRVNGYEVSETANNRDGLFTLKRPGPFWVIVTGQNGCSTRVDGVSGRQP